MIRVHVIDQKVGLHEEVFVVDHEARLAVNPQHHGADDHVRAFDPHPTVGIEKYNSGRLSGESGESDDVRLVIPKNFDFNILRVMATRSIFLRTAPHSHCSASKRSPNVPEIPLQLKQPLPSFCKGGQSVHVVVVSKRIEFHVWAVEKETSRCPERLGPLSTLRFQLDSVKVDSVRGVVANLGVAEEAIAANN